MNPVGQRGSGTLLRVAMAVEAVLLVGALAGYWQGAEYVEFTLRRSVEHAASLAYSQWVQQLEALYRRQGFEGGPQEAHLLPIPTVEDARLLPPQEGDPTRWRLAGGPAQRLQVAWGAQFSDGLQAMGLVRAQGGCLRCHPGFSPGAVVGTLTFHVPTDFLTKLLKARQLNLATLVGLLWLLTSLAVWVTVGVAFYRQRRTELVMEQAQQALAASEERYRTLVEHSLVGVYLIQGDRFLYCNPRMAEMFGYSAAEVMQEKRVQDLVAPEDRARVAENLRRRFAGEIPAVRYSFTALKRDGTRFPVEVFGARTLLPSGPAVQGMIVDNTAAEEARRLIENAYRAVVALPGENVFQAAVSSLALFLDAPVVFAGEVEGGALRVLGAHGPVRGDQLSLVGTPCHEVLQRKAGVEIPQGYQESFGRPTFVDLLPECYYGYPLLDSSGQPRGVLALLDAKPRSFSQAEQQIFEIYAVRLGRELERLQLVRQQQELERRLAASEKLAALGELAGGIAHDFNNVLAGILAEAELLGRQLSAEHAPRVQRLAELAKRGGEVVRRILAFARPGLARPVPLALSRLVEETVELASHTFGPQWRFSLQVEPDLYVSGEEATLQQAFLNLLTNARDAMPQGGPVSVRAFAREGWAVVEVQDQGVGIDPALVSRVFEPFFTTKPAGQGSGLGLTTAFRTVEAHGGTLQLDSRLGQGTTVTVRLPAIPPPAGSQSHLSPGMARGGEGTAVLLVEDEQAVREGLRDLLVMEGFRVFAAEAPEVALQTFVPGHFQLAIVDVLLPGMSGIDLGRKLLQQDPHLAVIFASGHSPDLLPAELVARGRVAFLQKPFTAQMLLKTLHQLLQGS
ncbi:MAG: ATP-binding protein [Thermoanaerobaculum sp.]|nr:ATP-binding protein [Thermoanaerobaculum sp.]